jgi:hypothetical protein
MIVAAKEFGDPLFKDDLKEVTREDIQGSCTRKWTCREHSDS